MDILSTECGIDNTAGHGDRDILVSSARECVEDCTPNVAADFVKRIDARFGGQDGLSVWGGHDSVKEEEIEGRKVGMGNVTGIVGFGAMGLRVLDLLVWEADTGGRRGT